MKRVCIVGASGKLGQYMVQHALDLVILFGAQVGLTDFNYTGET